MGRHWSKGNRDRNDRDRYPRCKICHQPVIRRSALRHEERSVHSHCLAEAKRRAAARGKEDGSR